MPDDVPVIELKDVCVKFELASSVVDVLNDITVRIGAGQRVGVVGPSGCGKTTFLRTICGFIQPVRGCVLINGVEIDHKGCRPNFFGMMFQEAALLDWRTVKENIILPFELRVMRDVKEEEIEKRVEEFLFLTGLSSFTGFRPAQLSLGMRQRVALIRCLITRPEVLLLDEPFGALDPITRSKLWQELDRIASLEKVTMVLVTHSIEEAVFLSDIVIVLSQRPASVVGCINVPFAGKRAASLVDEKEFLGVTREIRTLLNDNAQ